MGGFQMASVWILRIVSLLSFASGILTAHLQWKSVGETPTCEPALSPKIVGIAISALVFLLVILIAKALKSTTTSMLVSTDISTYTMDEPCSHSVNSLEKRKNLCTYTPEELVNATSNFSTQVGRGMSGFVYRAILPGGRLGAVKRATELAPDLFIKELSVLLRLPCHPNLVDLIGFCLHSGEQHLVFEYIANGSLYDRLHKNNGLAGPISWADRMDISYQVAKALKCLHEKANPPILHRDIKSANVLLVKDNHAKLTDFGLSKLGPRDKQATLTAIKGTRGYIDPLYENTGKFSTKSDVYSFGVLLLELITGLKSRHRGKFLAEWTKPNRLSQRTDQLMKIVDPNLKDHINKMELQGMINIANLSLQEIGEKRPSMKKIVNMMQEIRDGNALRVELR